jgi:histidinol-phosphate phosphatase family protein
MTAATARPTQLVVLAGGMGTRLAAVTGGLPKALVPVGGKPVLERQVELAVQHGIHRVLLLLGYGAEHVVAWTQTWTGRGVDFSWQIERQPRGTGGALVDAMHALEERFVLFFADQLIDFDVGRLVDHHLSSHNAVTVVVHPNDHPHDSDVLEVGGDGRVTALHRPPHEGRLVRNVVNAATYVIDRRSLESLVVPPGAKSDLARDMLPTMIARGTRVGAYRSREYLKDMGTPERLAKVEADLASGIVASRRAGRPMPGILLDRDGTVNVEKGRIACPDDIELTEGIAAALKRAHAAGYLAAIVTNQPVIARGDCTFAELDAIHGRLEMLLAESHAYVDGIFVCPHHPDRGFEGEVPELKGPCRCRKPNTGLVEDAAQELNLDLGRTWLIGDSSTDVACAVAAGLFPVLVSTGHAGRDARHDTDAALRFSSAAVAVEFIVDEFPALWQRCLAVMQSTPAATTISAYGSSAEMANNVARLTAIAAARAGRQVSLRLLPPCGDSCSADRDRGEGIGTLIKAILVSKEVASNEVVVTS